MTQLVNNDIKLDFHWQMTQVEFAIDVVHVHNMREQFQGLHCSSIVNTHERALKGYYLEQACNKCMYKRHIAIKLEVDIHEAGDKAIEKYMYSTDLRVYAFKSDLDQESCISSSTK